MVVFIGPLHTSLEHSPLCRTFPDANEKFLTVRVGSGGDGLNPGLVFVFDACGVQPDHFRLESSSSAQSAAPPVLERTSDACSSCLVPYRRLHVVVVQHFVGDAVLGLTLAEAILSFATPPLSVVYPYVRLLPANNNGHNLVFVRVSEAWAVFWNHKSTWRSMVASSSRMVRSEPRVLFAF